MIELPKGYAEVSGEDLDLRKAAKLLEAIYPFDVVDGAELASTLPGENKLLLGITHGRRKLVGYASLALYAAHQEAALCDLAVAEAHRHQGLGKYLVERRVELAEAAGAKYIVIPRLMDTNTLTGFYAQLGFAYDPRQEQWARHSADAAETLTARDAA